MKNRLLLLSFLLFFVLQFGPAKAKDEGQSHAFKIKGNTHLQTDTGEKIVEYDPGSADHLIISNVDKAGRITFKEQYLFTGKEFDLSADWLKYIKKNEIMADGPFLFYKDGNLEKTIVYSKEKIISETSYYPNGRQQSLIPGAQEFNGEYKMWHPNGQISFSGNYKDNLKEGEFELFDESGKSLKKGVYQKGKLLSGEPVIMDIIYKNPQTAAAYPQGEEAFNHYLSTKAKDLGKSKIAYSDKEYKLNIFFDEKGRIADFYNNTSSSAPEKESVKLILKDCPAFTPAMEENIPVKSSLLFTLKITAQEVTLESEEKFYTHVDEYPEFRGGPVALRNYLSSHIKYPAKAIESRLQGKVFVSFIVNKDGKVSDANVVQGVHPLLDEEAVRVVMEMPNWKPGKMHEKPVRVSFTLPITFSLAGPANAR